MQSEHPYDPFDSGVSDDSTDPFARTSQEEPLIAVDPLVLQRRSAGVARSSSSGPKAQTASPSTGRGSALFLAVGVAAMFLGVVTYGTLASVRLHGNAIDDMTLMLALMSVALVGVLAAFVLSILSLARRRDARSVIALAASVVLPVAATSLGIAIGIQVLQYNIGHSIEALTSSADVAGRLITRLLELFG